MCVYVYVEHLLCSYHSEGKKARKIKPFHNKKYTQLATTALFLDFSVSSCSCVCDINISNQVSLKSIILDLLSSHFDFASVLLEILLDSVQFWVIIFIYFF